MRVGVIFFSIGVEALCWIESPFNTSSSQGCGFFTLASQVSVENIPLTLTCNTIDTQPYVIELRRDNYPDIIFFREFNCPPPKKDMVSWKCNITGPRDGEIRIAKEHRTCVPTSYFYFQLLHLNDRSVLFESCRFLPYDFSEGVKVEECPVRLVTPGLGAIVTAIGNYKVTWTYKGKIPIEIYLFLELDSKQEESKSQHSMLLTHTTIDKLEHVIDFTNLIVSRSAQFYIVMREKNGGEITRGPNFFINSNSTIADIPCVVNDGILSCCSSSLQTSNFLCEVTVANVRLTMYDFTIKMPTAGFSRSIQGFRVLSIPYQEVPYIYKCDEFHDLNELLVETNLCQPPSRSLDELTIVTHMNIFSQILSGNSGRVIKATMTLHVGQQVGAISFGTYAEGQPRYQNQKSLENSINANFDDNILDLNNESNHSFYTPMRCGRDNLTCPEDTYCDNSYFCAYCNSSKYCDAIGGCCSGEFPMRCPDDSVIVNCTSYSNFPCTLHDNCSANEFCDQRTQTCLSCGDATQTMCSKNNCCSFAERCPQVVPEKWRSDCSSPPASANFWLLFEKDTLIIASVCVFVLLSLVFVFCYYFTRKMKQQKMSLNDNRDQESVNCCRRRRSPYERPLLADKMDGLPS